ncbi:hypothetical protein O181_039733 [Austropuccinia psidii MF-1]|uniref:Uncharacterized protein n=1 Tax=Austropuccinia psidii MF-1 TaxID=1389203 RepID=A0A9Q3HC87_9BASI|nr:hypothetical protein [Austropuccinia psidii MF-1]
MSRQRQQNVNHHMCHMRISLKAQTHFNTIHNARGTSPHWLLPPQRLGCLRACTALQMRLRNCPLISVLTTPYVFTPPPLPSLRLQSALPTCSQHSLPSLCSVPSRHAPDTIYHPYARRVPSRHAPGVPLRHAPGTAYHPYASRVHSQHAPHTTYLYACVVPSRHASDTAYHPYACGVPARHAPDTTYRYACVVPSQHAPNTTYPYTCVVPSQHGSNTDYHPYACGVPSRHPPTLLTILTLAEFPPDRHSLPSLRSRSALPKCSQHCLPSALPACSQHCLSLPFRITSIVYGGLLAYTMNTIAKIC